MYKINFGLYVCIQSGKNIPHKHIDKKLTIKDVLQKMGKFVKHFAFTC